MKNLVVLRDLLINASDFQWNESLFLQNGEKWDLNSSCYLFVKIKRLSVEYIVVKIENTNIK
ncbi:DUF7716 domain-containing protein [Gottfriedia acidiceleris]|uniref:DUF7716 domain-containing protein n=1 Tax=Gottfriedia acidiceleris TaxID=371036 RepID=UPI00101D6206|nr:hypothetical protein [Gottfriedia acidiceleris]